MLFLRFDRTMAALSVPFKPSDSRYAPAAHVLLDYVATCTIRLATCVATKMEC